MATRRGLGDVLHYFISEEEQETARKKTSRAGALRWALCADAARPLRAALAVDIAACLAQGSRDVNLISGVAPALGSASSRWHVARDAHAAMRELESSPETPALLVCSPGWLAALETPRPLDVVLVPVDPGERGVQCAAATLRALPRPVPALRLATLVLGASDAATGREIEQRLAAAATGLVPSPEALGALPHDTARFRSLLVARPLAEIDAQAASARRISDVCVELGA